MKKINPFIISLFLLIGFVGCEKEKEELVPTKLYGAWKLIGFVSTADNTLREAEPKDCDECYTITFLNDGTITGHTSTNELWGQYRITGRNLNFIQLGGTEINELYDGRNYVEALYKVYRFEIKTKQLILFYDETDYLLFKKR